MTPVVLAAAADSLAHAAAGGRVVDWMAFQERWHEFFLMTGTAAVTLAGLLFVAISIHVDTLIHPTRVHLLGLARSILLSYVLVLTFSIMMLVPAQGMRPVAMELFVLGLAFFILTSRQLRIGAGVDHPEFPHSLFRRRLMPTLIGYLLISLTGLSMLWLHTAELFFLIISALCLLLGNATGTSWDLLVRSARIRRHEAAAGRD